jgi:MFS family permease
MLEYWRFFRRETSLLTYGVSLTFLSSVGQTFLVSLFVPHFLQAFDLTEGSFGLLYSGATLGSALLLPWVGQLMDREHLHRFTLGVVGLLAGSAFLMAGAWHVAVLGVALLGVRLGGQGLSSHAALTAMARYFEAGRGKALSISNLGFPLGEGVLPLLLTGALAWAGWRWTWVALGTAVVLTGPLLLRLLRRSGVEMDPRKAVEDGEGGRADREGSGDEKGERNGAGLQGSAGRRDAHGGGGEGSGVASRTRSEVLRDPTFWFVLPAALLPAFWITGFFLYQTAIAGVKGWSVALMASAFFGFAVIRVVFTLATGGGVDRFSARGLFPFAIVPMGIGIALLWLADGGWVAYAFMALLGVSSGMGGAVQTALWAEMYGTRYLGAIKSMLGSLMVMSTAASPPLVGFVLEGGGLDGLLAGAVASVAVGALLALRVVPGGVGKRPGDAVSSG